MLVWQEVRGVSWSTSKHASLESVCLIDSIFYSFYILEKEKVCSDIIKLPWIFHFALLTCTLNWKYLNFFSLPLLWETLESIYVDAYGASVDTLCNELEADMITELYYSQVVIRSHAICITTPISSKCKTVVTRPTNYSKQSNCQQWWIHAWDRD